MLRNCQSLLSSWYYISKSGFRPLNVDVDTFKLSEFSVDYIDRLLRMESYEIPLEYQLLLQTIGVFG